MNKNNKAKYCVSVISGQHFGDGLAIHRLYIMHINEIRKNKSLTQDRPANEREFIKLFGGVVPSVLPNVIPTSQYLTGTYSLF